MTEGNVSREPEQSGDRRSQLRLFQTGCSQLTLRCELSPTFEKVQQEENSFKPFQGKQG